jgi:hypothetical protein
MTLATNRPRPLDRAKFVLPAAAVLLGGLIASQLSLSSDAVSYAAAAGCTMTVPAKISINTPYLTPAVALAGDCASAGVIEAKWQAKRADGTLMNELYFNRTRPSYWDLFDAASLGTWTWHPAGARGTGVLAKKNTSNSTASPSGAETAEAEVPQNTPVTDIRLWGGATLVSWTFSSGPPTAPCGLNITFNASAIRYAAAWNGNVANAGAAGSIQWRPSGSSTWTNVASITTGSNGAGSVTRTFPGKGDYRVWINDAQYVWASSSSLKYIEGCAVQLPR